MCLQRLGMHDAELKEKKGVQQVQQLCKQIEGFCLRHLYLSEACCVTKSRSNVALLFENRTGVYDVSVSPVRTSSNEVKCHELSFRKEKEKKRGVGGRCLGLMFPSVTSG